MTWEPLLEAVVEIGAPPGRVWPLVSDVTRLPEWSPQVTSTRWRDPEAGLAVGAVFTNRNVLGELVWTTHGEVVRLDPEREIAFRVEENWVVWSFVLEPVTVGGVAGTRLVQRRETPDGISALSLELTDGFMGGQESFTATLRDGMRETLDRVRAAAEGA